MTLGCWLEKIDLSQAVMRRSRLLSLLESPLRGKIDRYVDAF